LTSPGDTVNYTRHRQRTVSDSSLLGAIQSLSLSLSFTYDAIGMLGLEHALEFDEEALLALVSSIIVNVVGSRRRQSIAARSRSRQRQRGNRRAHGRRARELVAYARAMLPPRSTSIRQRAMYIDRWRRTRRRRSGLVLESSECSTLVVGRACRVGAIRVRDVDAARVRDRERQAAHAARRRAWTYVRNHSLHKCERYSLYCNRSIIKIEVPDSFVSGRLAGIHTRTRARSAIIQRYRSISRD